MAVVWDAKAGRLVRETDAEREIREAEARQARAQFESDQSRFDSMRGLTRDEQRRQAAYRQKQEDEQLANESGAESTRPRTTTVTTRGYNPYADIIRATNRASQQFEGLARGGAEEALGRISGLYAPQISAAETARADELRLLRDALTGAGGQVDAATAEYLQNLAPTRAFENVPLLALEAQENPLLEALRSQGAGTAEVEAQAGLDTALANQLRALAERSAQQYGATESAYVDALRRQALGGQMAGRQYLATRGAEAESNIGTRYADLLNELRAGQTQAEADVATNLQKALEQAEATRLQTVAGLKPITPKRKKVEVEPKFSKPPVAATKAAEGKKKTSTPKAK